MTTPHQPTLQTDTLLAGRFRICNFLGEGAMGEVYAAEDQELEAQVAVKLLRPEMAGDQERLLRFKREIHLARQVTHPNVCRLFDLFRHDDGQGNDLCFVTMELLEGETLARRLERGGRLDPAPVVSLMRGITAALTAAHAAGVVHRDLKTDNIMLVPDSTHQGGERAVITDFGLARGLPGEEKRDSLTEEGQILGSPAYMAPEQLLDEAITTRTDLYSLGVMLFEMVTGQLPFEGESAIATALLRLDQEPPSPRQLRPDLDPRWEGAILRCLRRDPRERFADASAVIAALAGNTPGEEPEPTEPVDGKGRPALPRSTLATLAALVAVLSLNATLPRLLVPPDPSLAPELTLFPTVPTAPAGYPGGGEDSVRQYRQGIEALRRMRPQEARTAFAAAWEAEPQNPWIRLALTQALIDLGDQKEARQLLALTPPEAVALPQTVRRALDARRLELDDQPAAAATIWGELHHLFPSEPAFLFNQALAVLEARDPAESLELLRELKRRHPPTVEDPRVQGAVADALYLLEEPGASRAAVRLAVDRLENTPGEAPGTQRLLARLLYREGELLHDQGQTVAATAVYRRSARLALAEGDRRGEAQALYALAIALREDGALDEATGILEAVIESFQQLDAVREEHQARWLLAFFLTDRQDWERARHLLEQLRAEAREVGDRQGELQASRTLAGVLVEMGETAEARRMYAEVEAFCEFESSRGCLARIWRARAYLERRAGDLALAEALAARSLATARELHQAGGEAVALAELGRIAEQVGDPETALAYHHDALKIYRRGEFLHGIAQQLTFIGQAETARGNFTAAEEALREALALRRETGPSAALKQVEAALEALEHARHQAGIIAP